MMQLGRGVFKGDKIAVFVTCSFNPYASPPVTAKRQNDGTWVVALSTLRRKLVDFEWVDTKDPGMILVVFSELPVEMEITESGRIRSAAGIGYLFARYEGVHKWEDTSGLIPEKYQWPILIGDQLNLEKFAFSTQTFEYEKDINIQDMKYPGLP